MCTCVRSNEWIPWYACPCSSLQTRCWWTPLWLWKWCVSLCWEHAQLCWSKLKGIYSLIEPSVVGYQATLSIDFKNLQKRIITNYIQEGSPNTNTKKKSSITCLQSNIIPPYGSNIPPHIFSHTDSTLMICQKICGFGIFPAIDPLDSSSCMMTQFALGERHYRGTFDVLKLNIQRFTKHLYC